MMARDYTIRLNLTSKTMRMAIRSRV